MLKIFLSYSEKDKILAGELKKYFEEYSMIDCFIAHDDIIPGSTWEQEILANLESAQYFMPLQTENLKNSFWCQQEAGFAVASAQKIKIISLIPDIGGINPIGFYAKYQGFKLKLDDLRGSVKGWLAKEGIIKKEDADELDKLILLFERSNTFFDAEVNTKLLFEMEESFTRSDILRIIEITLRNDQILYSWNARKYLKNLFIQNAKIISKEQLDKFLKAE